VTRPKRRTPDPPKHQVDWQQASHFHGLIHGDLETEFRLINPSGKTVSRWGDLIDVTNPDHPALTDLQRLNDNGYGAYMVINSPDPAVAAKIREGKGSTGDQDIAAATALFVDIDRDESSPGANLSMLQDAEVPPSLIVQSSAPHKVHAYWLVTDLRDMNLWRRLQAQLIAHFGADPVCRNPSRIMRIPGFWHHKSEPVQTRILEAAGTVYSVDELVELFGLDPELQLDEAPPLEAPDGYHPPAVQLLLDRPFTRRMTHKVHQTDKGRHNTVLWWAQHLRENYIDQADALATAATFAGMLPARHVEGPIPPEEVEDAIRWAYAKRAGRNRPVRQTGLETVAVSSSDQGNASGGSGAGGDDLDEVTRPAARSPITIQAGGYAKVRDTREGPTYTQLTNWTFTPTLALHWPDGTTGHRGTLTVNTTHHTTIDIPAKAWASRRDLLAVLAPYDAVAFTNANADIAHIRQFTLTNHPGLPTARGVTTYGLHKLDNAWIELYEDTHHPKLFYVGTPVDPSPAFRSLRHGTPDEIEEARRTIALLPHLITSAAALALLGYAMAAAHAPRITPALGDRLPFLYLTGERESGKSSSIELVLALTTGHPSARLRKAAGLTPYQYDSAFANLNNRLAAIDEYRPGSIDDAQLRKHHDLAAKYRGSGVAAKDHAYWLNAPLIVAGEGFTEDAAALSRGPLYFINKEHRGETKTYLKAQAAPNHAYADHLANAAATLPETAHQARLDQAWAHSTRATNERGGPRLQFALTWIAYGLLHLQHDLQHLHLDMTTDAAIQRTLQVGVEQTLDGGDESKTNLETFLEQLGSAAADLKDPSSVIVPTSTNRQPVIRLSGAVELVKRKYKDPAISNPRQLRQYAGKVTWINTGDTHRDRYGSIVRGIRIDLANAPERCDLGMLEALEDRIIRENR